MANKQQIPADVNGLLWSTGWNWGLWGVYIPIGGIVLGIISVFDIGPSWLGIASLALVFGGPVLALSGIIHVRRNYERVRDAGIDAAQADAERVARLDEMGETQAFSLRSPASGPSLLPPIRHDLTSISVGEIMVNVHDDQRVHMKSRTYKVGDDVNELYYDQFSGVNYKDGKLWINMSDGHGESFPSSNEPNDVLNAIRDRLRAFKQQQHAT